MPLLDRVRHVKRGTTYDVLGDAEVQISKPTIDVFAAGACRPLRKGTRLTVYRSEAGKLWVRFPDEFRDGRFEFLPRGRLWWPQHFCDEAMPCGTRRPEDWISGALGEGSFVLGPEERDERLDYRCITASLGDEVEFAWHEDRGSAAITIHADGTWHGTEPEDYSHAWEDGESEGAGDSIDEVVRTSLDFDPLEAGDTREITLCFGKWGSDTFRFALDTEGSPTFVPVEGGGS